MATKMSTLHRFVESLTDDEKVEVLAILSPADTSRRLEGKEAERVLDNILPAQLLSYMFRKHNSYLHALALQGLTEESKNEY